jgi:hypothetical protein
MAIAVQNVPSSTLIHVFSGGNPGIFPYINIDSRFEYRGRNISTHYFSDVRLLSWKDAQRAPRFDKTGREAGVRAPRFDKTGREAGVRCGAQSAKRRKSSIRDEDGTSIELTAGEVANVSPLMADTLIAAGFAESAEI